VIEAAGSSSNSKENAIKSRETLLEATLFSTRGTLCLSHESSSEIFYCRKIEPIRLELKSGFSFGFALRWERKRYFSFH